jgi:hypothetical protein
MPASLEIHWLYLVTGLALLLYPRQWMRFGKWRKKRRRERETAERFAQDGAADPSDKSVRLGRELLTKRNYLDFFRALAGGMALWEFSFVHDSADKWPVFGLKVALTLLAVVVQVTRFRERITFFAAIFFFAGLSIGMGNYVSGSLAFLLTCTINPVIPNPRVFVSAFGLLLLPFNYFLGGDRNLVAVNSAIILLAPLVSLLLKRPMVVFTRKRNLTW